MKLFGRTQKNRMIFNLALKHPIYSFIQSLQKIRQAIPLDQKLLNGYSLYPSSILIELTNRCNLRCKTCWYYGNSGIMFNEKTASEMIENELTIEDLKKFIDKISFFKPNIILSGGEPLIRKDIFELINYIEKKGLLCNLITNGTLINEETAKLIVNSNLDIITISLDGPEEINNKVRNSKDGFKKIIQGIKYIQQLRNKTPYILINFTISDFNYKYLFETLEIAKQLKIDLLQFSHQWFIDNKTFKFHNKLFNFLFSSDCDYLRGYINNTANKIDSFILNNQISLIKKQKDISVRFYPDLNKNEIIQYYSTSLKPLRKRCNAPWHSIFIRPNGDVMPCLGYHVGNIKQENFLTIWNNKKFQNFRYNLKRNKHFPGCIRCCGFFT